MSKINVSTLSDEELSDLEKQANKKQQSLKRDLQRKLKSFPPEVSRSYHGLDVVDAEDDLRLSLNEDDIRKAKPGDFEHCVLACAASRQFRSEFILFCRTVAYLDVADHTGNRRIERYVISGPGQKLIKDFDLGKNPKPGTVFVLNAPPKSNTLEYNRNNSVSKRKKAKLEGTIYGKWEGSLKTPKIIRNVGVRNGTGKVQMKRSEAAHNQDAA